ncbi:hypothetical protein NECAME_09003 [Necator americanus]|uniref:Uncharacterized protein n=1 Tax=Necator americanus TaxID=51031 RepID=W2THR8_NECAM|nr:hypothetical protein NECAME_09003 [Necator americanus]ETN80721.1 hypothetical protein NECAME_09003 [Necator americanus]
MLMFRSQTITRIKDIHNNDNMRRLCDLDQSLILFYSIEESSLTSLEPVLFSVKFQWISFTTIKFAYKQSSHHGMSEIEEYDWRQKNVDE